MDISASTELRRGHSFLLALFSLAGIVLVLFSTARYGAGLSPDSTKYISAARHLISGDGLFISHSYPGPLVAWPPLFPATLAGFAFIFGVDPLLAARLVNAVLFGVIVHLSGRLTAQYFTSMSLIILLVAATLLSAPLIYVSVFAFSEPMFTCFCLLAIVLAQRYSTKGGALLLILFSITVALAVLTRYAGVTLIMLGLWVIAFWSQRKTSTTRLLHLALFLFLTLCPLGLWMLRNHLVSPTLTGARPSSLFGPAENFIHATCTVLLWYSPDFLWYCFAREWRGVVVLLVVATSGCLIIPALGFDRQRTKARLVELALPIAFVLIYVLFLVTVSSFACAGRHQ